MSTTTAANPPTSAIDPAAITDTTYRGYDGELRLRSARWWAVAVATIRASVNRKKFGYWIPAFLILTVYFFSGILHYFTQNVREQMAAAAASNPFAFGAAAEPVVNPFNVTLYSAQINFLVQLCLFVAALIVGSATISADSRANALLVYFARPLTRADYLLGKWVGVFLLLAPLSLVPPLLLFGFFAFTYADQGFLSQAPSLLLRLVASSLLPPAVHASLIIGLSALSKTPRIAGAAYAGLYFVTLTLSGILGEVLATRDKAGAQSQLTAVASKLSVQGVPDAVAMSLYDVTPTQIQDRWQGGGRRRRREPRNEKERESREAREERRREALSRAPEQPNLPTMLLIGGALIALPLAAAAAKVRAVEVVRG